MAGEATNDDAGLVRAADVDEAAARLAEILREEHADVLTIYDDHGGYGHPDHIQVHRVGVRAAELAGTPRVYESTMNRDYIQRSDARAAPTRCPSTATRPTRRRWTTSARPRRSSPRPSTSRDYVERKRAAMAAHASQIPADSFFLPLPLEAFREAFGYEWFIRRDAPEHPREPALFDDLWTSRRRRVAVRRRRPS